MKPARCLSIPCVNLRTTSWLLSSLVLALFSSPGLVWAQPRPDLEPDAVSAQYDTAEEDYNYSVQICNFNATPVMASFKVKVQAFSINSDCAALSAEFFVDDNLGPTQNCVTKTGNLVFSGSEDCRKTYCMLRATVDSDDSISEDDETNNVKDDVFVTNLGPDLTINDSVTCVYNTTTGQYEVVFNVENQCGDAATLSGSTIRIRIWNAAEGEDCEEIDKNDLTFDQDELGGGEHFTQTVPLGGEEGCKCCRVWLDNNENITEVLETNNTDNDNIISSELVVGTPVDLRSEIVNITDIAVTVTNEVVNPPRGWDVDVTPATVVLPPRETAPITLTYVAPVGAKPATIQVLSTEAETGFTQDNLFAIGVMKALPTMSTSGLVVLLVLLSTVGAIALIRHRRAIQAAASP